MKSALLLLCMLLAACASSPEPKPGVARLASTCVAVHEAQQETVEANSAYQRARELADRNPGAESAKRVEDTTVAAAVAEVDLDIAKRDCVALMKKQAIALAEASRSLEAAELRWRDAAPESYAFTVKYSAFGLTHGCESQSFRVSGGHPSAALQPGCKSRTAEFGTVPALFRFARRLLADRPHDASMQFDPSLGYPVKIYTGSRELEDAYFEFEVVKFEVGGDRHGH